MAKINVKKLQEMTEKARVEKERKFREEQAERREAFRKEAKPIADKLIQSLPRKIVAAANMGSDELEAFDSLGSMRTDLFRCVAGMVGSWCGGQNLMYKIVEHPQIGSDSYPYYESFVISWKKSMEDLV